MMLYTSHVKNDAGEWAHEFGDCYRSVSLRRSVDGGAPSVDLGSLIEMDTPWGRFAMLFSSRSIVGEVTTEYWTSHGPPIDT